MLLRVNDVLVVDGMVEDVYRVLLTPDRLDAVDVSSPLTLRYDPIRLDRRNGMSTRVDEPLVLLEYVDFRYDSTVLDDGKYVLLVVVGKRVEIAGILFFVA